MTKGRVLFEDEEDEVNGGEGLEMYFFSNEKFYGMTCTLI